MKKETVGSERIVKATARTIITSTLAFVVGLYMIAIFMNKKAQFPSISLESQNAVYTITRTDGTTETYDQNHFPLVHYGETLTVDIDPLEDVGEIQNGTLVFSLYHCYVSVYCGDELIYEQTEPEEGHMIGHRYYMIPLPDGYENETIRITAVCAEHDTFNSLIDPKIIPADRTTYAFRTGHFATGIILITLLISSIFMLISSIITGITTRRRDGLLSISFLCAAICLWYMGFSGYMQPFVESTTFLAEIEYIGLYLCPIALSFFIQSHTTSRRFHTFCFTVTVILTGFFVFATFMTIFVPGISYVDYVEILRIMFLFTLLVLLYAEIRERKAAMDIGERTLHRGMAVGLTLGVLELVRFLLAEQFSSTIPWITHSIMPLCIIVLALTAIMYYGVRVTSNQYQKIEQENLKRLAYVDQLTGAPNRAACYRRLDEMEKNGIHDYVVTFIDINFLKKTNDTWGHDKGDELIRTASDLLHNHFTGDDFFGRWGGDEFIAVHLGTLEETRTIMHAVKEDIDSVNAAEKYDFTLSESWGYGESTAQAPLTPAEAIRLADQQMYEAKQKAHAARE